MPRPHRVARSRTRTAAPVLDRSGVRETPASPRDAIDLSARLIEADPLDEAAWRANLAALVADGQASQAQRAYRAYAARLASELGVEPSVELRTLVEGGTAHRPAPGSATAS